MGEVFIVEVDLKKYIRDYAFLLGLAGLIVLIDQFTKELVRTHLALTEEWAPWPWMLPYFRIVHWSNTGAAFGMFQGFGLIFTVLAIAVVIAILYYFPRVSRQDWPMRIAMCLMLAGACGNLIDRLTQNGQVTDFISVGSFAVFNIADASITLGVVILILGVWTIERREKKQDAPTFSDHRSAENPAQPRRDGEMGE